MSAIFPSQARLIVLIFIFSVDKKVYNLLVEEQRTRSVKCCFNTLNFFNNSIGFLANKN